MRTKDPNAKFFRVKPCVADRSGNTWMIDGYPNGVRIRGYFQTKRDAQTEATKRNTDITVKGSKAVLSTANQTMAAECVSLLATHGKTLYDATHHYLAFLKTQAQSITVAELCERVVEHYTITVRDGGMSQKNLNYMRDTARRLTDIFGARHIKTLNGKEVYDWLATTPFAVKTKYNYFGYARRCFSLAFKWGLLDEDIFARCENFKLASKEEVSILTVEEMTKFMNALEPKWVPAFALNAFSGLRRQEVERLHWDEINLDQSQIILPAKKGKNKKRRILEIAGNLKAWLAPYARAEGSVIPPGNGFSRALTATRRAVGLMEDASNDLRHSFCSYAAAWKGCAWAAYQADHTEAQQRKDYQEMVTAEDAERYFSIRPTAVTA